MGAHVIWFGPVSREQRAGATVEGATEHFVSCTGDGAGGTPRCRVIAESYADGEGRRLPGILHHLGIPEGEELYFGAFSAGGSAVKLFLAHPDDRAAVRAVLLADATYELRGPDGKPASSPALVAYASEALESGGRRMFVATASSAPNVRLGAAEPSGVETLERIAGDIEARSGTRFDLLSYLPGIEDLHPVRVWTRGTVTFADFGAELRHQEHATKLAPALWPRLLQPWIDRAAAPGQEPESEPTLESRDGPELASGAGAVVAVAALVGAFWWLTRRAPAPFPATKR
jgi:hypothetical protein